MLLEWTELHFVFLYVTSRCGSGVHERQKMFRWCVWYMQHLRLEEVWWYPKIITLILSLSYFYRLVLNPVNSCFVMVKMWAKALKWFSGINNLMTFRLFLVMAKYQLFDSTNVLSLPSATNTFRWTSAVSREASCSF